MSHINLGELLTVWDKNPSRHTAIEDVQGIVFGCIVASLGLFFLNKAELLIGGTAGAAFLVHYLSGWNFGLLFFVINLPFYYLSWRSIGIAFTVKTFIAVAFTSFLTGIQSQFLEIGNLDPLWAAIVGGVLLGFGLLALYRHRASLGGVGILAVYVQDRTGFRAGFVQMAFDAVVLVVSFFVVSPMIVLVSVIAAMVLNMFIAVNHRADRYIVLR